MELKCTSIFFMNNKKRNIRNTTGTQSYKNLLQFIAHQIRNKRPINSFKRLGNNAVSLTKFFFISTILNNLDNYVLTDKTDGLRTFLILNRHRDCVYINGETHQYISLRGLGLQKYQVNGTYILDCEYARDEEGYMNFYVFDVLVYENRNVSWEPFKQRLQYLKQIQSKFNLYTNTPIQIKFFSQLRSGNYQSIIQKVYDGLSKTPYETDGLIFTSLDSNYYKTKNYKWKPVEKLTIDFFCIRNPLKTPQDYLLFNGITDQHFQQLGFSFSSDYLDLMKSVQDIIPLKINGTKLEMTFFPCLFQTNLTPNNQSCFHDFHFEPKNLHGKIVELSYDSIKCQWIFNRIREDRQEALNNGTYYGNYLKIAELNFASLLNPLTIGIMTAANQQKQELLQKFYFKKDDSSYLFVRKMNSYVKRTLINKFAKNNEKLIDLGSGKGQDLLNYYQAGVRNLLILEYDRDAIDEITKRKYEYMNEYTVEPMDLSTYQSNHTYLKTIQMDLNQDFTKNTKIISEKTYGQFTKNTAQSIFCNFAFHYFIETIENLLNIASLIDYYLIENGGTFIMTILDGEKVQKLLKNGKWQINHSNSNKPKYLIESIHDTKIRILLPCSSTMYEETLVDDRIMDDIFKNFGMTCIEAQNHDILLDEFQKDKPHFYNKLDEHDKFFIGLYKYKIYKKKKRI